MKALRIGTRGSPLALWQAHAVAALLEREGRASEICVIKTSGDRLQDAPLSEAGGKGLFVKEIEDALLSDAIDLAVHSAKDMSVALPEGLGVAAVLPREDSRDALVCRPGRSTAPRRRRRRSGPAASAAARSSRGGIPAPGSCRFAATSTRGCGSWMPASTTPWCSRSRA